MPIAAYHPQSNRLIERGHQPIIDALTKLGPYWVEHVPAVLWVDRITTRRSTGFAPYKLVFGQDCMLPVETEAMTWAMVNWKQVQTREQLLAAGVRQFERREEDLRTAADRIKSSRQNNKEFFDKKRRKRNGLLKKGDMVLLYNSRLDKQWSKKLDNRWNGLYLINDLKESRGTYLLEELAGTVLEGIFPQERLKRFFLRRGVDDEEGKIDKEEEVNE